MNGYGYQWKINPLCCRAAAIEAGNLAPECEGGGFKMLFTAFVVVAVGLALFAPVKGRRS